MTERENLEDIGKAMMAAWKRIKNAQARMWGDWMTIGEGLLEGRRWAMQVAGTNKPEGKGYVMAYAEWLKRYRVDDMDKSDRAKLLQLMEERPGVEEWRATLTDYERRNLNNPTVAWRKWTAATRVTKPKPRSASVSAAVHGRAQATVEQSQAVVEELEQELAAAREEIETLKARIRELEGDESWASGELLWTGDDDVGYLAPAFADGKPFAFAVVPTTVKGLLHFEARQIANNADLTLPLEQLAARYSRLLQTHDRKNRLCDAQFPTAEEAQELCEDAFRQLAGET